MPETPSSPEPDNLLEGLDPKLLFAEVFADESPFPQLPGFEIQSKLGEGGMGTVYRAWQESLQREVALKLVRPELVTLGPKSVFDRLEREARAMAKLKHPNLVAVHDFIRFDDESAALVLELIEGETLRTLLDRHEDGLPFEVALPLVQEIGAALETAHGAGLVHRDVKPENVLIDLEGHAHVTDFGLALPVEEESTRFTKTGNTVGTLAYLAPEQLDGDQVNVAADQFSFGVVIYEMLTGIRARGVVESPHELRREITPAASRILLRALSRKPAGRHESVARFVADFLAAQKKGRPFLSRRSALLAGGSLLTGGAVAGGMWMSKNTSWTNLLETVDVEAAIKGSWRKNRDGSVTSERGLAILPLLKNPSSLPDSYEVICEAFQEGEPDAFGLCFESRNGFGAVEFNDNGEPGVSGLQKINGVMLRNGQNVSEVTTRSGQWTRFRLLVDQGTLSYYVEGELIQSHKLSPADKLHLLWNWDWTVPQEGLALASLETETTFRNVRWRSLARSDQ